MIKESEIAANRQKLFGEPWWKALDISSALPRTSGSTTNHCDICPLADGESCTKPCAEAKKQFDGDGITVS